jgi:hypothetical protein
VETANIDLNGSIAIWVNAKRKLDYSLKASCQLFYAGNPKLGKTEKTQAAIVQKIKASEK